MRVGFYQSLSVFAIMAATAQYTNAVQVEDQENTNELA